MAIAHSSSPLFLDFSLLLASSALAVETDNNLLFFCADVKYILHIIYPLLLKIVFSDLCRPKVCEESRFDDGRKSRKEPGLRAPFCSLLAGSNARR